MSDRPEWEWVAKLNEYRKKRPTWFKVYANEDGLQKCSPNMMTANLTTMKWFPNTCPNIMGNIIIAGSNKVLDKFDKEWRNVLPEQVD